MFSDQGAANWISVIDNLTLLPMQPASGLGGGVSARMDLSVETLGGSGGSNRALECDSVRRGKVSKWNLQIWYFYRWELVDVIPAFY